ncbi:MAG: ISL3 family transposase [Thermomicrobiales bacterium]
MHLTSLFPQFCGLRIDHVCTESIALTIVATTTATAAECPICHQPSSRVHSRYHRRVADLPCAGRAVARVVHAHRFFCPTADCPRRTFRERLPALVVPDARRSHGLRAALGHIAFALGGEAGRRLAAVLGMPTSADTLLRLVCAAPAMQVESPRVLGVDDWAWRKATRYGTILCDLERHRVVDLLPDRSADTVATWLGAHPSVAIIARDRSDLYADGATRGAPDAVQVADRFHLLKNLGDALERFLQQKRAALKQATAPPSPPPPPRLQPWQERMERESERRHAPWITRYERVIALRANDAAIADIAREVGISGTTVYRYLRLDGPPARKCYRARRTPLDPYKGHLLRRWDEGCHVATRLWREIRAMGYAYSYTNVSRFLAQLRLPVGQRPSISRERGTADKSPTPRQVAMLFVRRPGDLADEERVTVERVCMADTAFATAHRLAQDFAALLREREGWRLDAWIAAACASEVAEVRRFAQGLSLDEAAVRAGLTLEWSNGQTEGQVNRLKMLKRQMYGRAGFVLLRQRLLHGT